MNRVRELEANIRRAMQRTVYARVPPLPSGLPAPFYTASVKAGIVWINDPESPGRQIPRQPAVWRSDPDGTLHMYQWEDIPDMPDLPELGKFE